MPSAPAFALRSLRRATDAAHHSSHTGIRRFGCLTFYLRPRSRADSDKTSGPPTSRGFSHLASLSVCSSMDVSDAKRLKALESENACLKKLLAESMLEAEVTREALRKKW